MNTSFYKDITKIQDEYRLQFGYSSEKISSLTKHTIFKNYMTVDQEYTTTTLNGVEKLPQTLKSLW